MRRSRVAALTVLFLAASIAGAGAQPAARDYCRRVGIDDTLRAVPPSLIPSVVRLFHLEAMPAEQVARSSYFRCAGRHVLVCTTGANLVCGRADTRRQLPGAGTWCAEHPDSPDIPAYVTGHATIYRWHCAGSRPAASPSPLRVDPRGFIAQHWKQVDAE